MKPSTPASGQAGQHRRPPLWPGLLLNMLLPGSGFSYLNRPWLHLAALVLTVLDWFAAWLLLLWVGYARLASPPALPEALSTALVMLGVLMALASYGLLVWTYLRLYRRGLPTPARPAWLRWLLILLHLGGLLLLVLPPLLGRTIVL